MHFYAVNYFFYSFKGIWQIIPTCHLTAKQSSFWVSNILKNQLHEIYPYDILIFSVICMHHAVMTYYDVNGKWRNCCPKQSILKIWIEITLFFPTVHHFPHTYSSAIGSDDSNSLLPGNVSRIMLVLERETLLLCLFVPVFLYFSNNNVYTTHPSKFLTARPLMMVLYMKRGHYFAICYQWNYFAAWYES